MSQSLWVCRAGEKSVYLETFIQNERIYLPWDGYEYDLSIVKNREDAKKIVSKEKGIQNSTTIATWGGMIYSFVQEMRIKDKVLIPGYRSREYYYAEIVGNYEYLDSEKLRHSRKIHILKNSIPRGCFEQSHIYSLGAYRTLFKPKDMAGIIVTIEKYGSK